MTKEIIRFLHEVGIDIAWLIAGLSGGLVSLRKDEKLSVFQKIITVISGGIISAYLTPIFMIFLSNVFKDDQKFGYGVAFVVGYSGLKAIELIFSKFNSSIIKETNQKKE